jgi:hypothetical protein
MFELFVAEIARSRIDERDLGAPAAVPDCVPAEWTEDAVLYALEPGPPWPSAA